MKRTGYSYFWVEAGISVFFCGKSPASDIVLAQNIICWAQEQREAVLRGVRLRNRVGVSLLDWNLCQYNSNKYQTTAN